MMDAPRAIVILDFGGQYTQLIARRVREMSVYSEIFSCTHPLEKILAAGYQGIILSGGPSSVYAEGAPLVNRWHKQFIERLTVTAQLSPAEWDEGFACFDTEDYRIGVEAFLKKAKPEFKGK